MKFISLILSIYILALNFAFCEDSTSLNTNIKIEISQNMETGHMDYDLCSPFCLCHCCQIYATYFNDIELTVVSNCFSTNVFSHFDSLGKDILNTILQPPRV